LIAFTQSLAEVHEGALRTGLDRAGMIFFVLCRSRFHLEALVRAFDIKIQIPALNGHTLCFGLHSDAQDTLVDCALPERVDALESYSPALWLDSTARLRMYVERVAKAAYQLRQDPMDSLLYYVLARKLNLLQGLFKKAGQDKVGSFLQRDFINDSKAQASACNNAYTLISKGCHEAAAAFFILGNAIDHAITLAAINLGRPLLALLIARLATRTFEEEAELMSRTLRNVFLPIATRGGDRGVVHIIKWRLNEITSSYCILWSNAAADNALREPARGLGKLGGILSRFDEECEAAMQSEQQGEGFGVEDGVHPCTLELMSLLSSRPKARLALRMQPPPLPPLADLAHSAAAALVCCGCASLIVSADLLCARRGSSGRAYAPGEISKSSGRRDPSSSEYTKKTAAVSVIAARGWLSDYIRFISSEAWLVSFGEITSQNDLCSLHEEMQNLMRRMCLSESQLLPQLIRFCQIRGLWRIKHALVTGQYGRTGRDSSLAEVAMHPLTLAMIENVSKFATTLCQDKLHTKVLIRMERMGKLLQLVLHSLIVDNDGNTGALTVLSASVLMIHFILIWARNDFEALRALLLRNEGMEDDDSSMALAWLMEVCNPEEFIVGSSNDTSARAGAATTRASRCNRLSVLFTGCNSLDMCVKDHELMNLK
jgi:hypothetical protein